MTRLRKTSGFIVPALGLLLLAHPSGLLAAEKKTITLKGQVDVSGLKASPGRFTIRALRPQNRKIKLGKTETDGKGSFSLKVEGLAVAVYGVVLQATSKKDPALVLEAAVLRIREAQAPITISLATTVDAAMIHWKVLWHGKNFKLLRPAGLYEWLRPVRRPKAGEGLKRAKVALVKWAHGAAAFGSPTSAAIVQASVGDIRQLRKRLAALKAPPKAIEQVEQMVRTDPEVAYLLMMPYLLEM